MLRQLHFYYVPQFWHCSGGCTFIIFRSVGHVHAAIVLFSAMLAMCRGAAFVLFLRFLAMSKRLEF